MSISNGSRTSTSTSGSPASRRCFSSSGVISGTSGSVPAVASAASAQASDRDRVRAHLTTALESYVAAFSDGRVDFIADSVYTAPAYFFGGGGVEVRTTRDEVRDRFQGMWAPLPAQGYDRSEIRGSDVCVLSDSSALVTLHFARVRTDGSVMTEGTAMYYYAQTADGWRIIASMGSTQPIACD